jgi:hypothetical protein
MGEDYNSAGPDDGQFDVAVKLKGFLCRDVDSYHPLPTYEQAADALGVTVRTSRASFTGNYASGTRSWCARKSSAPRGETSNAALSTTRTALVRRAVIVFVRNDQET